MLPEAPCLVRTCQASWGWSGFQSSILVISALGCCQRGPSVGALWPRSPCLSSVPRARDSPKVSMLRFKLVQATLPSELMRFRTLTSSSSYLRIPGHCTCHCSQNMTSCSQWSVLRVFIFPSPPPRVEGRTTGWPVMLGTLNHLHLEEVQPLLEIGWVFMLTDSGEA